MLHVPLGQGLPIRFKMSFSSGVGRKKKITPSAVTGKIIVVADQTGERIGQWGGTECYLSFQRTIGPCLVVRSSKHRRGDGTFFKLENIHRIFSSFVQQGKLAVMVRHGGANSLVTVHIQTTDDGEELWDMLAILRDRSRWAGIEKNVGGRGGGKRARGGAVESSIRDPNAVSSLHFSRAAVDEDDLEPHVSERRHGVRRSEGSTERSLSISGNSDDVAVDGPSEPSLSHSSSNALPWEWTPQQVEK